MSEFAVQHVALCKMYDICYSVCLHKLDMSMCWIVNALSRLMFQSSLMRIEYHASIASTMLLKVIRNEQSLQFEDAGMRIQMQPAHLTIIMYRLAV